MKSRLGVRSRSGRPRRTGKPSSGGGLSLAFPFGDISMFREFWAEDPDWTDPGDGGTLTSVRDNGSESTDLSILSTPKWAASAVDNKPAFDFTSGTTASAYVTTGSPSTTFSTVVVCQFDNLSGDQVVMDDRDSAEDMYLAKTSGGEWYSYNSGLDDTSSGETIVADTPYLVVTVFEDNNLRTFVNGVKVLEALSGTVSAPVGMVMGASYGNTFGIDGYIPYLAVYEGDITDHADYAEWTTAIAGFYGITI